ncbi:DUF3301 domain-containing protein [Marinicella gelatinilytica]|uniref:DUF3301 domain-containing protein n=1 Tax=Marinicella gelatinilytica TaxID=2996017 RepID=UPI002260A1EA|nr:DUF3301 domain-containing protein [Marinicella gelatinilytica]MCX7545765.1 DUF3301 domain-containing protein [Marinicella gelatinilytica]
MFELTLLMLLGFIIAYWYNQTKAIEEVRRYGKQLTRERGYAFLDDSVVQQKIRIKPRLGRMALLRVFDFEFSDVNAQRHSGHIKHHGGIVIEVQFNRGNDIETLRLQNF